MPPVSAHYLDDILKTGARLSIDAQGYPERVIKNLATVANASGAHLIVRRADTLGDMDVLDIARRGGSAVTVEV